MLVHLGEAIRKVERVAKLANEGIFGVTRHFHNGECDCLERLFRVTNVYASRNCTKHQVRCDYMEYIVSDSDSQPSPEQPAVVLTPGSENRLDLWQQTGSFPYPDLQVFPTPQTQQYSKNELRLSHHLSSICNMTIWTQEMPK